MQGIFDYIVIGAGSAGCVMASRLSEDARVSVCLVEAGGRDRDPRIHVPALLGELLGARIANWNYETEPQPALNGRRLYWPRGKVLGGSSSINAMCYSRGDLADYDDWADAGADGWSGREALSWFRHAEDYSGGEDQWHGTGGPLGVQRVTKGHPASMAYVMAGGQAGYRRVKDFNAGAREGIGLFDKTVRGGRRCSAATAYLPRAVRARPNLTIVTGAMVRRILFDGVTARGIEMIAADERRELTATREVVLCAGAINSPQLLMLSGIGPASHLSDHGISTIFDLPGVGENLQDHLDIAIMARSRPGTTIGWSARSMAVYAAALAQYALTFRGLMTSNIAEGNGFMKSRPELDRPDIQLHFLPGYADRHGADRLIGSNGITLHACHLYPSSRGTVRLHSSDPDDPPAIDPAYLTGNGDIEALIAGGRIIADIATRPAMKEYALAWRFPPELPQSEEAWAAYIRARAETQYHPVGTCRMGARDDEGAVTDGLGAVYGAKGLRLVDASLMPSIVGGNTNAPVIMMAEKIAAAIRG